MTTSNDQPQGGMPELTQAIAALGQINLMIPMALAAGTALVRIIRSFRGSSVDADEAINEFERKAQEIANTAQVWLQDHPATPPANQ